MGNKLDEMPCLWVLINASLVKRYSDPGRSVSIDEWGDRGACFMYRARRSGGETETKQRAPSLQLGSDSKTANVTLFR